MSLDWVLSVITLASMWLAGNKNPWAWRLGLANQVLWVIFAWQVKAYGLLPLAACLTIVYSRNLWKWNRQP